MSRFFSKHLVTALLLVSSLGMLTASFNAEARRMGGGGSFGRQSLNVTKQRQAITPPAAKSPAAAAQNSTAGARGGASRWLGPLAGIAAGLGIAALLSHLGLSGAFLETISSMVLIGLVLAAVIFLVRRLLAGARAPASAAAGDAAPGGALRSAWNSGGSPQRPAGAASSSHAPAAMSPSFAASSVPVDGDSNWVIPHDFDSVAFLAQAKKQFAAIQTLWDSGEVNQLAGYLTDDLMAEIAPQVAANQGAKPTEIVLLNAELLGVESVEGGHLASVRYSGMLREDGHTEAFRFQEVWNLYKSAADGWLLAGIQQISA
ncbi:MAG TPA: TIM44-like domain-containing protein [Burkholderiaceae bacterium]|nr:TIM44-like domain-containing protein [Burkholderiaceae bacterium]